ncbi:hypothetical protein LEP1GSC036_2308 [Leptospira weilii str. 2006001853]|uniref:SMI1/KNR4 family protein n=1 Tax=Leptospira weilii str. 2006001853 TaxID=1001589 RepID=A0A828YX98_9LEPT|nr:hypothetical protein [Leptospira weilii]EKR62724.1 hypothetical protein LEP1GSC036_2308 [Leptospira weilii str. 2006001853]EMN45534.1 hypothetical protein LEP1GSC086_2826 [Leptospira weilii str. LNT 1234]QDK25214.1 SMI1/KNR4 family protein [Leptospira weilii]QDK29118.1 SMI1/KNR4 family protein [Leptospira weilii]
MSELSNLIQISSKDIGIAFDKNKIQESFISLSKSQKALKEIIEILNYRNGFMAFESALHFFHFSEEQKQDYNIIWWNNPEVWKSAYQNDKINSCFCFAEDAFGNQFCFEDDVIYSLDAETGEFEFIADSIENWAEQILSDYEFFTGYSLIHNWQQENGAIPFGYRLIPKIPFCLGGEYSLDNLHAIELVKAMNWRGEIFNQIKDLPEGSQINFSIIE